MNYVMPNKLTFRIVLAALIFNSENKFLLAKRSENDKILPGHWGLPGGNIDIMEDIDDILEKELKREVMEEVDIEIDSLKYLESHLNKVGKLNICFIAKIKKGEPKALDETEEVGWFNLNGIRNLKLTPHTLERVKRAYKYSN